MHRTKVFGIGFHKTGTSTLQDALATLGYRVTGPNFASERELGDDVLERLVKIAADYDAFQDNPWPIFFREMDEQFPGSKFVLTIRDPDSWYASALRHFGTEETGLRKLIYGFGAPAGNETIYKDRMIAHNESVLRYFAARSDDLLVMNFSRGDGWQSLCSFLGKTVPAQPFPHSNSAASPQNKVIRYAKKVRSKLTTRGA